MARTISLGSSDTINCQTVKRNDNFRYAWDIRSCVKSALKLYTG